MRRAVGNVRSLISLQRKLTNVWSFRVLQEELAKLVRLSKGWIDRKVADYDDEKSRIAEIFKRANEARIRFGVRNICFHV